MAESTASAHERLLMLGLTEEEIASARAKLNTMFSQSIKEINQPNNGNGESNINNDILTIDDDAKEILLMMCLRGVQSATEFACKLARHRNKSQVDTEDFEFFMNKMLQK